MSLTNISESSESPASRAYPGLKPFAKGFDARRGHGIDAKTRNTRRKLAKLDGKALKLIEQMLDRGDVEGLKIWAKYRLPLPGEKTAGDASPKPPVISPQLAARLAALDG